MNKAVLMMMVLVLVVGSLFALAQQQEQDGIGQGLEEQLAAEQAEGQECGFWCKVGKFLSGEGREKAVGEALSLTRRWSIVGPSQLIK